MGQGTTLEQQRAANAWECSQTYGKDHVNVAKGLPALIMNSGLMQVLAFCNEKGGPNKDVATHLQQWLAHRSPSLVPSGNFGVVMVSLMKAKPGEYQAITAEAFDWLRWLRQMAPARLQSKAQGD